MNASNYLQSKSPCYSFPPDYWMFSYCGLLGYDTLKIVEICSSSWQTLYHTVWHDNPKHHRLSSSCTSPIINGFSDHDAQFLTVNNISTKSKFNALETENQLARMLRKREKPFAPDRNQTTVVQTTAYLLYQLSCGLWLQHMYVYCTHTHIVDSYLEIHFQTVTTFTSIPGDPLQTVSRREYPSCKGAEVISSNDFETWEWSWISCSEDADSFVVVNWTSSWSSFVSA